MASVGIGDEDAVVSEGDFDWLLTFGALVEQVEAWLPFVVWYPSADGLPEWLEGLDVVAWFRRRWEIMG